MSMDTLPALNWIIGFLKSNDIPYVACGGLAAKVYGAERKLNDIDIYVPDKYFYSVVEYGAPYITYGPSHHKGDGPHSDAVRDLIISNAVYWTRDFHIDAIRLDAVHGIFDSSVTHILKDIRDAVHGQPNKTVD